MAMAPVVLVVIMGVLRPRDEKKIKKDLMKIDGVEEVFLSLLTGRVAIVTMADPAALRELLASKLKRPVFLLPDFGAPPAPPPMGGAYGGMPPPSSPFPAPTLAGGYQPYGYCAMPIEVLGEKAHRCSGEKKMAMAPVALVVDMGVLRPRDERKIKKDLMKIAGVEEVFVSLVMGRVGIVAMADPAALGELLASKLRRPVFILPDFGAPPAPPPMGGAYGGMPPPSSPFPAPTLAGGYQPYGYCAMPPPSPAPSSHLPPAPPVGGYYSPYVYHNQLRYATPPPPEAGYSYTPFGGRPWGPHYMRDDPPVAIFEDEGHDGCCCSIQ